MSKRTKRAPINGFDHVTVPKRVKKMRDNPPKENWRDFKIRKIKVTYIKREWVYEGTVVYTDTTICPSGMAT